MYIALSVHLWYNMRVLRGALAGISLLSTKIPALRSRGPGLCCEALSDDKIFTRGCMVGMMRARGLPILAGLLLSCVAVVLANG